MSTTAARLNHPPFERLDELQHEYVNDTQAAINQHADKIDALFESPPASGVQSVDGLTGPNVELPASDVYPSQAKRSQVVGLFTSGTQTEAADVQLSGDPRTDYLFATFYDFAGKRWYCCLPNPTQPVNGSASAWWVRR